MMKKREARQEWQQHIAATADAWQQEFGERTLDEEWTTPAFEDIPGKVVATLGFYDPWRQFCNDVVDELNTREAQESDKE